MGQKPFGEFCYRLVIWKFYINMRILLSMFLITPGTILVIQCSNIMHYPLLLSWSVDYKFRLGWSIFLKLRNITYMCTQSLCTMHIILRDHVKKHMHQPMHMQIGKNNIMDFINMFKLLMTYLYNLTFESALQHVLSVVTLILLNYSWISYQFSISMARDASKNTSASTNQCGSMPMLQSD